MDEDIKKQNVVVDSEKQRQMLEYTPKVPIITDTDNREVLVSDQELRADEIVKKIKDGRRDAGLSKYPWEDLEYDGEDEVPKETKKKYEKKTYVVTPARVAEVQAKNKSLPTSYITVNVYGDGANEGPYGSPSSFIPRTPSPYTNNGKNHICGWPFKLLPNSGGKFIEGNIQAKPAPDLNNGKLPNSTLAAIKAQHSPNSKLVQYLQLEAAAAFNRMYDAAKKDNVTIYVRDAYRTYNEQVDANKKYNKSDSSGKLIGQRWAAIPGTSNHGWGKAIDVWPSGRNRNCKDSADGYGHGAKKWINLNGDRFGWYWGDAPNEDWHFVYVW